MLKIQQTDTFAKWFKSINDQRAKASIITRIKRFQIENLGDVKSVGQGVHEARIFVGKGYRLYFCQQGDTVIVLLCGGIKSNKKAQQSDIAKAKSLAKYIS